MGGSRAWMLRLAALMGAGAFCVHQARYAFGYGGDASGALATQGHAYLVALGPLLVGLLLPVVAELIRRSVLGGEAPAPRFGRLWAGASVGLAAAYLAQESIEGALATGHPAGFAGAFGHGGWSALPLALAAGLAIALLMRGASAAPEAARRTRPWSVPLPAASRPAEGFDRLLPARAAALFERPARGPPAFSA